MRLLTIHQPWAWLIVAGHKRYENRSWSTSYRGPLLIHAGMSRESLISGKRLCDSLSIDIPPNLVFGAIVGRVLLVDCLSVAETENDPFASGPFCFRLADHVIYDNPVRVRGALGLIQPSTEILAAIPQ